MRFPLLLLVVIPITELYLLFALADLIGGLATLGIVIATAAIGLSVLKRQGFNTLRRADQRMRSGQLPGQELVEGFMLALAGVMLLTPGLISDTVGFLLLTPPVRRRLAAKALRNGSGFFVSGFSTRSHTHWQGGPPPGSAQGDIIDGEVVERESRDPRLEGDSRRQL